MSLYDPELDQELRRRLPPRSSYPSRSRAMNLATQWLWNLLLMGAPIGLVLLSWENLAPGAGRQLALGIWTIMACCLPAARLRQLLNHLWEYPSSPALFFLPASMADILTWETRTWRKEMLSLAMANGLILGLILENPWWGALGGGLAALVQGAVALWMLRYRVLIRVGTIGAAIVYLAMFGTLGMIAIRQWLDLLTSFIGLMNELAPWLEAGSWILPAGWIIALFRTSQPLWPGLALAIFLTTSWYLRAPVKRMLLERMKPFNAPEQLPWYHEVYETDEDEPFGLTRHVLGEEPACREPEILRERILSGDFLLPPQPPKGWIQALCERALTARERLAFEVMVGSWPEFSRGWKQGWIWLAGFALTVWIWSTFAPIHDEFRIVAVPAGFVLGWFFFMPKAFLMNQGLEAADPGGPIWSWFPVRLRDYLTLLGKISLVRGVLALPAGLIGGFVCFWLLEQPSLGGWFTPFLMACFLALGPAAAAGRIMSKFDLPWRFMPLLLLFIGPQFWAGAMIIGWAFQEGESQVPVSLLLIVTALSVSYAAFVLWLHDRMRASLISRKV